MHAHKYTNSSFTCTARWLESIGALCWGTYARFVHLGVLLYKISQRSS